MMDQLTRFARELADRLSLNGDGHGPVSVAEIREQVLPYRLHRRALGLASVEDYETMLLRLVAEEAGHVRTEPAAAAERCREELALPNPDLGVLEEVGNSTVEVVRVGSLPSAPQGDTEERMTVSDAKETIPAGTHVLCPHCSTPIPEGRPVTFCPWCGERLTPITCSRCGTELDAAWRHCITCGATQ